MTRFGIVMERGERLLVRRDDLLGRCVTIGAVLTPLMRGSLALVLFLDDDGAMVGGGAGALLTGGLLIATVFLTRKALRMVSVVDRSREEILLHDGRRFAFDRVLAVSLSTGVNGYHLALCAGKPEDRELSVEDAARLARIARPMVDHPNHKEVRRAAKLLAVTLDCPLLDRCGQVPRLISSRDADSSLGEQLRRQPQLPDEPGEPPGSLDVAREGEALVVQWGVPRPGTGNIIWMLAAIVGGLAAFVLMKGEEGLYIAVPVGAVLLLVVWFLHRSTADHGTHGFEMDRTRLRYAPPRGSGRELRLADLEAVNATDASVVLRTGSRCVKMPCAAEQSHWIKAAIEHDLVQVAPEQGGRLFR